MRGLAGRQDSPVVISFESEESALACLHDKTLLAKVRYNCDKATEAIY